MKRVYLGDSVYAQVENGMIVLTTNNGYPNDPRNTIALESEVFAALTEYFGRWLSEGDDDAHDKFRAAVRERDVVNVDNYAVVSRSLEGAFVAAWVWVTNEEAGVEPPDEGETQEQRVERKS